VRVFLHVDTASSTNSGSKDWPLACLVIPWPHTIIYQLSKDRRNHMLNCSLYIY